MGPEPVRKPTLAALAAAFCIAAVGAAVPATAATTSSSSAAATHAAVTASASPATASRTSAGPSKPAVAPLASLPSAPQTLGGSQNVPKETVTWTWKAPATDGGSPVTGYRLSTVAAGPTSTLTVSASTLSHTYTDWARDTDYSFTVQAITKAGVGPAASDSIHTAPAPSAAPTGVSATPLPLASATARFGSALIQWTQPAGALGPWVVSRDGTDSLGIGPQSISTNGVWDTSIVLNHLIRGRTYTVTVAGNLGQGLSSTVTVRVGPELATPPRNLVLTRDDKDFFTGTVSAAWAPPVLTAGQKVLGYQVTVQPLPHATPTVVVLPASARSYTTGDMGSTITYLVSVSAVTASGAGPAAQGAIQIGDTNKLYP
ncbi:hypothetical protein DEI82_05330 [Curtobacterium sp. MCBD17_019]|nr:hypothetical protein DEI82_05330 [Curtobacterium sp. MCBD17_019]